MFLPGDRTGFRRVFVEAWRKRREGLPAEALEIQVADVVAAHPEYHPLLESVSGGEDHDYVPEDGETNPFLHMGLHLAIREQVSTDRPPGVAAEHARLSARLGVHEAEHRMMEALGEALWRAQRNNRPADEVSYLEDLRRLEG